MKWLTWIIATLVVAAGAHLAFMFVYPNILMSAAMQRLSLDGAVNVWRHAPRMTEEARLIVRPSPDLAYSSCVYDLSNGPVRISMQPWGDYMSLSLFAANTDNYFTLNDRAMAANGVTVILHRADQNVDASQAAGAELVESPSARGIALIRRLAATPERFADAERARGQEVCAAL